MSIHGKMATAIAHLLEQGEIDAASKLLDAINAQATKTSKPTTRTKKENFPSRLKAVAVSRRPEYQSDGVYQVNLFYHDVKRHLDSLPASTRCQKRVREHFNAGTKLAKAAWVWYSTRGYLRVARTGMVAL